MALRAIKHKFTGSTTAITAYDYTKTNLGSLMIQNTGSNPEDKFVGPRPVLLGRPSLDLVVTSAGTAAPVLTSLYSTGTAAVSGATVTGTGTTWTTASHAGKLIGFGSTNPLLITAWYTIATRNSNTSLTLANGTAGVILTAGAYVIVDCQTVGSGTNFGADMVGMSIGFGSTNPASITQWYRILSRSSTTAITISGDPGNLGFVSYVIVTTMMYPHAVTISSTKDWIFLVENSVNAVADRRISLYEYNKSSLSYTWIGHIIATLNTSTAHTIRGFRALRYLHTTGEASASGTADNFSQ